MRQRAAGDGLERRACTCGPEPAQQPQDSSSPIPLGIGGETRAAKGRGGAGERGTFHFHLQLLDHITAVHVVGYCVAPRLGVRRDEVPLVANDGRDVDGETVAV